MKSFPKFDKTMVIFHWISLAHLVLILFKFKVRKLRLREQILDHTHTHQHYAVPKFRIRRQSFTVAYVTANKVITKWFMFGMDSRVRVYTWTLWCGQNKWTKCAAPMIRWNRRNYRPLLFVISGAHTHTLVPHYVNMFFGPIVTITIKLIFVYQSELANCSVKSFIIMSWTTEIILFFM